jgi:hypothetical protein
MEQFYFFHFYAKRKENKELGLEEGQIEGSLTSSSIKDFFIIGIQTAENISGPTFIISKEEFIKDYKDIIIYGNDGMEVNLLEL